MNGRTGARAPEHAIVIDLGFGDAGKGVTVDLLCSRGGYGAVVRANGGAQAAHNVVAPDGRHHTFSQFGAGTLAPGDPVPTHLSRFVVVDPFALAAEARHLTCLGVPDPLSLVTVDRRALISTPWHAAANQTRERARGRDRHGSCGMGVGETMAYALDHPADAPTVGDCASPELLRRKLERLADRLASVLAGESEPVGVSSPGEAPSPVGAAEAAGPGATDTGRRSEPLPDPEECLAAYRAFAERVRLVDERYLPRLLDRAPVVFEGAQGVLLDEWHGFHPYTTWSTTTTVNPLALLAEAGHADGARRIGVTRTFATRHGAGPMVTENVLLTERLADRHNRTHPWQGGFRVGHLDLVALRYALEATGGVDSLVVTHADAPARLGRELHWCVGYELADGAPLRIAPGDSPDLARQARLAGLLTAARPVLEPVPGEVPTTVADALNLPLEAVFTGPTRDDAHLPVRRLPRVGAFPRRMPLARHRVA
ncbi:adenylosuccinate synthetase [Nocardiopsis exhalans]|uniref:Adenylosuccinate synthetase n=1 Tax=Nocardiopsis exhalans TaxID=163604 RepID=A0ABY5DDM8_9ACTN|nr:adenylosuccinate synthetase [Nocardiopsis exhalans]USY22117.1 adenylosuccinate synthetase [Nocardiopsis exhalans]